MKKKSVLGLDSVKGFIVIMLSISIIAVVALIVLGTFNDATLISSVGIPLTKFTANETTPTVSELGTYMTVQNYTSVVCSNFFCINSTSSTVIPTNNITATNCKVAFAASDDNSQKWNGSAWKCSYWYSYRDSSGIRGVSNNVSTGIVGFFTNSGTFFALLGVVVIILIISLVIVVVNKFGGSGSEGGMSAGRGESVEPEGEGNL